MKIKWIALLVLGALVVLAATGAGSSLATTRADRSATPAEGPRQVTEGFYAWYLGYIGPRSEELVRRNPLVDGAYRTSDYLTPQFVTKVDKLLAGFDHGGYDPFLMAQDVPDWVEVVEVTTMGEQAEVTLRSSFEGHMLNVRLVKTGETWLIDSIGQPTK